MEIQGRTPEEVMNKYNDTVHDIAAQVTKTDSTCENHKVADPECVECTFMATFTVMLQQIAEIKTALHFIMNDLYVDQQEKDEELN